MPALFHVDAFAEGPFSGNPAAVCVLGDDASPSDAWMAAVAAEMNLSETAFVQSRDDGDWDLRWFTPKVEVDLCGHATLATAHVLWTEAIYDDARVAFERDAGTEENLRRLLSFSPSRVYFSHDHAFWTPPAKR